MSVELPAASNSYCKIKQKLINKCLVICIGISKYDQDIKISDIDLVSKDMENYMKTFKDNKNYSHIICNKYTQRNTKKILLTLFRNCLISELLDESGNVIYNSLLITISAHCTESGVICSDGEIIQFTEILSIFTESFKNKKLILNLPKFIIIDGDRGLNHQEMNEYVADEMDDADIAYIEAQKSIQFNNDIIMDTYSAIFCSKALTQQCSKLYSGQLSWNLCKILQENEDKNILFHDIINLLKQRLDKISNYQLTVKFIEHDMDIDDVLFPSNPKFKENKPLKLTAALSLDECQESESKSESKSNSKWRNYLHSKSQSLTLLSAKKINKKNQTLSPKLFFERAKNFSFSEDEEEENKEEQIEIDTDFNCSKLWNKTLFILSKNDNKIKIKMEWLFIYNDTEHFVELYHSQRLNPYEKTRKILNIDGKQIFSEKTTATQFTEMIDGNVYMISIQYDDNDDNVNKFKYKLKINNKSHKQLFNEWKTKNLFVE